MRRKTLTAALLALGLAACGPTPPQAPLPQAKKLDESTGGISTACGETAQLIAFPGNHRSQLITLEATAASDARKLASVYRRNPAWIYQGETIAKIVSDAFSYLDSCGLTHAATVLSHATHSG
jgi:hypothetical protein